MRRLDELVEHSHERLDGGDGEEHRFVLMVPADLPVLAGHFPGSPIVPAFVELREVVGRVGRVWPELGPYQGATALKFQAPIRPGAELELRLRRAPGSDRVRFTLTITTGTSTTGTSTTGTQCAMGTLVFGAASKEASS